MANKSNCEGNAQDIEMDSEDEDSVDVNRRKFVKTLGAAVAGVGAMALMPLSAAKTIITPNYIDTPERRGGGSGSSKRTLSGVIQTAWDSGKDSQEIDRIPLDSGDRAEIYSLKLGLKSSESQSSDFELEVYDIDQATVLASTTSTNSGTPLATSAEGTTLSIRLTNQTGEVKDSGFKVVGEIV